jgi:hypothetical protein
MRKGRVSKRAGACRKEEETTTKALNPTLGAGAEHRPVAETADTGFRGGVGPAQSRRVAHKRTQL